MAGRNAAKGVTSHDGVGTTAAGGAAPTATSGRAAAAGGRVGSPVGNGQDLANDDEVRIG